MILHTIDFTTDGGTEVNIHREENELIVSYNGTFVSRHKLFENSSLFQLADKILCDAENHSVSYRDGRWLETLIQKMVNE